MPDDQPRPAVAEIRRCLNDIVDPCSAASVSPMSLVEMGLVRDVTVTDDGDVLVELRVTSPSCLMVAYMANEATRLISPLPGVRTVQVKADAGLDWDETLIQPDAAERRRDALARLASNARSSGVAVHIGRQP